MRRIGVLLAALLAVALPAGTADAAAPLKGRVVDARSAAGFKAPSRPARPRAAAATPSCANADLAPDAGNLALVSDATLCLLNAERVERNRRPLAANRLLAAAARPHVEEMIANSYFAHDGLDGSAFIDRIRATGYLRGAKDWMAGENLAWGTGILATPREIVKAWMASPGHRTNILEPGYREIGVAVLVGNPVREDGLGATYGTEFGSVSKPAARRDRASKRALKRHRR